MMWMAGKKVKEVQYGEFKLHYVSDTGNFILFGMQHMKFQSDGT